MKKKEKLGSSPHRKTAGKKISSSARTKEKPSAKQLISAEKILKDSMKKALEETQLGYMNLKDFVDGGYLQELNRRFLHPLGLSMRIRKEGEDKYSFEGIVDYRTEPAGILFPRLAFYVEPMKKNVAKINSELMQCLKNRVKLYGFAYQPVDK